VDCFRAAIVSLTLLLFAAPANAGTVAIVQPNNPTAELTETVSRLHGELISVGLEVKFIAPPVDSDPDRANSRPWVEATATEAGIDALIDVVSDKGSIWVDIWVIEKSPRKLERWRVESEPNTTNASERLAIRAIEVLRSSFLESDMTGKEPPHEPRPKPTVSSEPRVELSAPPRRSERIGIGLGAALLTHTDGLGPAILPVVHFDGKVRTSLGVQAELAGLGTRSMVTTAAGSARVAQQYGVLGGSYRLGSLGAITPYVALCAGALRTSVQGEASAPRQSHAATQWSFLLDGSIGAALNMPGRFYVSLAGHAQLAEPYVAIHIVDTLVATSGRPNLVLTLTVGGWL